MYADDIAVVAKHLQLILPRLAFAFEAIEGATGLALKMVKCVLVCVGSMSIDTLRDFVVQAIPTFAECAIILRTIYLNTKK